MKRIIVAVLATLALAGCGTSTAVKTHVSPTVSVAPSVAQTPAPTTQPPATAPPTTQVNPTDVFLALVKVEVGPAEYSTVDPQIFINLANEACAALDRGATFDDLATTLTNSVSDPDMQLHLAHIVGFGIGAYCPQYASDATS